MGQTIQDLVLLKVPQDVQAAAKLLANERVKHEFNRFGLEASQRREKIPLGIVGELTFAQYLDDLGLNYLFYMVLGDYDLGHDFLVGQSRVDVKATNFRRSGNRARDIEIIFSKFHLYVADDFGQAKSGKFGLGKDEILLAGYADNIPKQLSNNRRNIFPAKSIPVADLTPISALEKEERFRAKCDECGTSIEPRTVTRVNRDGTKQQVTESVEEQMAISYRKNKRVLCSDHGAY